jgi:hypothetical protein
MTEVEEKQWAERCAREEAREKAEQEAAKKLFWDTVGRLESNTATTDDQTYAANRLKYSQRRKEDVYEEAKLLHVELRRVKKPCDNCLECSGPTASYGCSMKADHEIVRDICDELLAYRNAGISVPAAEAIRKKTSHKDEVVP